MRPKTAPEEIPRTSEIATGLEESAVVLVESGEARGYLIAQGYRVREAPSEIVLNQVIYLCALADAIYTADLSEVMIARSGACWSAVDTSQVCIVPCPARHPYPVVFISKHGFRWISRCVQEGQFQRLLEHLASRFEPSNFVTDRRVLSMPPFSKGPLLEGTLVRRTGQQTR